MEYTTNYQLPLWEKEDAVLRTDFNENNAKIDAAIAAVKTEAANALANYKTTNDAAMTDLAQQIAQCGNCKIAVGTYTGTGTWGADSPNSLTFDFVPKLIAISGPIYYYQKSVTQVFVYGAAEAYLSYFDETGDAQVHSITGWGTNTISWYSQYSQEDRGTYFQMNAVGKEYHYVAIG